MNLTNKVNKGLLAAIIAVASPFAVNEGTAKNTKTSIDLEIEHRLALADSLHNAGRSDTAIIVGEKTIDLAEKSNKPNNKVGAYSAQGVYLRSIGKIEDALKAYNKALAIVTENEFRQNPDQEAIENIATLYINLSVLNLDMQNKEDAVKNSLLAREWIEKSKDKSYRSMAYGATGGTLMAAGKFEEAKEFQDLAYDNAIKSGDKEGAFRAAAYSMLLADKLGNHTEVGSQRKLCDALLPEVTSTMSRLLYYQAECSIALRNNKPRESLRWFDKILSLEGIDKLPFVVFDCYNNMHTAYAELNEYKEAYNILLKSNELRDSIWETQKEENLRDLTVKYQTKETELELAKSESKKREILNWLLGIIALSAAGGGCFIYYSSRQKRLRLKKENEFAELRAETERRLTSEYLEGLETERLRMARELHDGICNDLLAIRMTINKEGLSDNAEKMIEHCREAVRRVSHELMPPEFAYATLDEVLRYYVSQQNKAVPAGIKINYSSTIDAATAASISDEDALEIYRIVQEATGNAIKYSGASVIKVTLSDEKDNIILIIEDNGEFQKSEKKGIGIESMRRRAKKLGGDVRIYTPENTEGHKGTLIKVIIKPQRKVVE